jgi:hypothetical protein
MSRCLRWRFHRQRFWHRMQRLRPEHLKQTAYDAADRRTAVFVSSPPAWDRRRRARVVGGDNMAGDPASRTAGGWHASTVSQSASRNLSAKPRRRPQRDVAQYLRAARTGDARTNRITPWPSCSAPRHRRSELTVDRRKSRGAIRPFPKPVWDMSVANGEAVPFGPVRTPPPK